MREHPRQLRALVDIGEKADRLAMAATAGQFRGVEGESLAIGREHENFRGRLREEGRLQPVVALELKRRQILHVPLEGADPALCRDDDGDRLALDHRLGEVDVNGRRRILECRAALARGRVRAIELLEVAHLSGDRLPLLAFIGKQGVDLAALLAEFIEFLAQRHLFELAQRPQPRVENVIDLQVGEFERFLQLLLCVVLLANDPYHLVEIKKDDDHAFQLLDSAQNCRETMARAAQQHRPAVVEPLPQRLVERHNPRRHPVDEHVHIHAETRLELGELEERLHHQSRIDVARARLEHDAQILRRFVAHVGDERQLALGNELRELFDETRLLNAVGNLGDDDDPAAALPLFLVPARAHAEGAAPAAVRIEDVGALVDDHAAGRKIGPLHESEQLLARGGAMRDEIERGVAQLGEIMGRNGGGHAHGNPLRAIGKHVGNGRGKDDRLLFLAGIIELEVDRVLVDALQQRARDGGHTRFRVAIGGG